jgi:hypothetical protein
MRAFLLAAELGSIETRFWKFLPEKREQHEET